MRLCIPLTALCLLMGCDPSDWQRMDDPAVDAGLAADAARREPAPEMPTPDALAPDAPAPDALAPAAEPVATCGALEPGPAEPVDPLALLDGPYHRCRTVGQGTVRHHA